jgi:hypothetical protein|tara:strand:+ start:21671 stop:21964 length:294 start_codon:yes stop_codon:yes gene_type:complete
MSKEYTTMTEANKNPEEVQSEQPSVTVNDLVNIYNIIDLASKRGAFQAAELSSVGAIANKVKAFVDHVQAQQKAAADAAGEAAGEQPAETTGEGSAS